MEVIDLRSDTVTQPTRAMRRAIANAELGDDGFGEDKLTNELELRFADRLGKEAAVFCPSGVMANQIAMRILTRPGDRVIAGRRQHLVAFEYGASALNAGLQFEEVDDKAGILEPSAISAVLDTVDHYQPVVTAIAMENSHMASGGLCWSGADLDALSRASRGLAIHLDGARLFNAECATGTDVAQLASPATTVMSCLSKGLSAPIGSLLAGPQELMERARMERKRLGGAMRQSGIAAAAGLIALGEMVERLEQDHIRAQKIAAAVEDRWPGKGASRVQTNIVIFTHQDTVSLIDFLADRGILADTVAPGRARLVTHRHIKDRHVKRVLAAIADAP